MQSMHTFLTNFFRYVTCTLKFIQTITKETSWSLSTCHLGIVLRGGLNSYKAINIKIRKRMMNRGWWLRALRMSSVYKYSPSFSNIIMYSFSWFRTTNYNNKTRTRLCTIKAFIIEQFSMPSMKHWICSDRIILLMVRPIYGILARKLWHFISSLKRI